LKAGRHAINLNQPSPLLSLGDLIWRLGGGKKVISCWKCAYAYAGALMPTVGWDKRTAKSHWGTNAVSLPLEWP